MAEVVGPTGRVIGVEIDAKLAWRASQNLSPLDHVEVVNGDGVQFQPGPVDAILINAGVTHPRKVWLDSLQPGRRLIIPVTTDNGRGGVLRVKREIRVYPARFIFTTQVFHCLGGRDAELSEHLHRGFARGEWKSVQSLRREPHERNKTCWLHGDGFCLSTLHHLGS
jgi:protein-L-isoaspartate(D-aspartate) O-methyltransferase